MNAVDGLEGISARVWRVLQNNSNRDAFGLFGPCRALAASDQRGDAAGQLAHVIPACEVNGHGNLILHISPEVNPDIILTTDTFFPILAQIGGETNTDIPFAGPGIMPMDGCKKCGGLYGDLPLANRKPDCLNFVTSVLSAASRGWHEFFCKSAAAFDEYHSRFGRGKRYAKPIIIIDRIVDKVACGNLRNAAACHARSVN